MLKAEEQKEKEAVEGAEPAVPPADETQPAAEDKDKDTTTTTPKSKKTTLLGKGIFNRIFSPRRDLQKSFTLDGDEAGLAYSVEAEGQILAAADNTEFRGSSKTASLDSKGRIPKSLTTGADRSEMVGVVSDTVATDTGRCVSCIAAIKLYKQCVCCLVELHVQKFSHIFDKTFFSVLRF